MLVGSGDGVTVGSKVGGAVGSGVAVGSNVDVNVGAIVNGSSEIGFALLVGCKMVSVIVVFVFGMPITFYGFLYSQPENTTKASSMHPTHRMLCVVFFVIYSFPFTSLVR